MIEKSDFTDSLIRRSDTPRTTQTDELIDNNDSEAFTWPLDPQLPLANRKQLLILHMRR
jgi:hypothetical protein